MEILNPDDLDYDNGTKLLNYYMFIGPGQGQSRIHTVEPDYSVAWLDQVRIMLTGDVQCQCLAKTSASNCVRKSIEEVSGDGQGRVPILLSLWSSLEAHLQHIGTSTAF
ncbi:hypothetical protein TNCV_899251 [Trichonephila clavipes]|nr:hypothetical protein TNCV_899251 [Trichonephila clavipes]